MGQARRQARRQSRRAPAWRAINFISAPKVVTETTSAAAAVAAKSEYIQSSSSSSSSRETDKVIHRSNRFNRSNHLHLCVTDRQTDKKGAKGSGRAYQA